MARIASMLLALSIGQRVSSAATGFTEITDTFDDTSYVNEYDAPFDNIQVEYFMSGVVDSVHSNDKEDRRWKFHYCAPPSSPAFVATTALDSTPYDDVWVRECADGQALIGGTSTHNNNNEDRQWNWYCGTLDPSQYTLTDCEWSEYVNSYDATFSYYCPNDGVMRGMRSIHNNNNEDRIWSYYCCRIYNGERQSDCKKGVNYAYDGVPCVCSGDPHCTTWSGAKHDFQGSANGQFYYLSQCAGSTTRDLPYSFIGKHTPARPGKKVQGLDHFTIVLHGETEYFVFISASLHSYIDAASATGTTYDDNAMNANLVTLVSGADKQIGSDFTFHYTQTTDSRIDAVLTMTADECEVRFDMQGQKKDSSGRHRMHAVAIRSPTCDRCHACGLCGDFKHSGSEMESCYGSTMPFTPGYKGNHAWAYDKNGNTWQQQYRDLNCATGDGEETTDETTQGSAGPPDEYTCSLPDEFEWEDPCEDAIREDVEAQCNAQHAAAAACCAQIGGNVCDSLLEDCKYDACVEAEGDVGAIAEAVQSIFTDAVDMVCAIPDVGVCFSEEHLVVESMPPTTAYPTTKVPSPSPIASPTTSPITSSVSEPVAGVQPIPEELDESDCNTCDSDADCCGQVCDTARNMCVDEYAGTNCGAFPIDAYLGSCSDQFAANELHVETLQSALEAANGRLDAIQEYITGLGTRATDAQQQSVHTGAVNSDYEALECRIRELEAWKDSMLGVYSSSAKQIVSAADARDPTPQTAAVSADATPEVSMGDAVFVALVSGSALLLIGCCLSNRFKQQYAKLKTYDSAADAGKGGNESEMERL